MLILILGLIVFFASHSAGIFAPLWRQKTMERIGKTPFMAASGVFSLIGLAIIVAGIALARQEPVVLRIPSLGERHAALGLNLLAFLLLGLFAVPFGRLRAWIGHPLLLSIILWASAHLLANGLLAHVVLFGSFLLWAVADLVQKLRQSAPVPSKNPPRGVVYDLSGLGLGLGLYLAVIFYLHPWLIGVSPLP